MVRSNAKKQEDDYDFVFEDSIDFVSQEVFKQKLRFDWVDLGGCVLGVSRYIHANKILETLWILDSLISSTPYSGKPLKPMNRGARGWDMWKHGHPLPPRLGPYPGFIIAFSLHLELV